MDTAATPPDTAHSAAQQIRVFILSDHGLVRQGLRDLLEHEGFDVAGESGSAAEAIRLVPVQKPDIVLLNDQLPDGTGIEVCRFLRLAAPDVKCLILTSWDAQHAVRAAVLAGATGYVLKQVGDNKELFRGIRSAASGLPLMGEGVRERVAESLYATASASWLAAMTTQERHVLGYMARGLTNRQIGQEMMLPDATVAAAISSVLEKLGFRRLRRLAPAGSSGLREPMR